MKIGVDVGNYTVCSSTGIIFEARCSLRSKELHSKSFVLDNKEYFIEEGSFDSEYRKVRKESYIKLLYASLCKSLEGGNIELGLGLPLSQYKNDQEELLELIMQNAIMKGTKDFIIRDVQVFPEGVVATEGNYEGILVDIGGRTTDVCFIEQIEGKRRVRNPNSLAKGMINLENEFVSVINSKFGANYKLTDFKRIMRNGVSIYGAKQDITFAVDVFKEYLEDLLKDINSEYDLVHNNITFTGGGSSTLKNSILKRLPGAIINKNSIMDNALNYRKLLGV